MIIINYFYMYKFEVKKTIFRQRKKEFSRRAAENAKEKKDFYLLISLLCFLSDLCGFA